MKNLTYHISMIIIVLITFSAFQPKPKSKKAGKSKDTVVLSDKDYNVRWDSTIHDFGKIKQGIRVQHKFAFTNTGRQPFIFTNVAWGYSGMVANYSREPVMSGKRGDFTVEYGAFNMGNFNKTFTVTSNAGTYVLNIKGEVVEPVKWDKVLHDFGEVKQGEQLEATFVCKNGSDTLRIENVMVSCGCVVPKWDHQPIAPNKSTEIKVIFNTKGKSGQHWKTISVYTNLGLYDLTVQADIVK